jgi:RIO kinase 2
MHDHSLSLSFRFNLSFEESPDDIDDSEVNTDENGRPCFSSIAKGAGSLDKELAASGFTRKDQEDIEKVCSSMFC